MRNRKLQTLVAVLLLACGVLVSATIDHGKEAPEAPLSNRSALDTPTLQVNHRPGRLSLKGMAVSGGHEAALRQIIAEQFGDSETETRFEAGVLLPDHWETTSMRLLHALAATEAAQAELSPAGVEIRGVTSDPAAWESQLELLRQGAEAHSSIRQDVVVIDAATPLAALCRRNLAHALSEPVAFRLSSAELKTSSYAVLDRLVGLAHDCRDSSLAITGHTDASGPEPWNRQLSLNRAQAVANYLIGKGLPNDQLLIAGAGSAEPIADNATAHGRSLNRRIEFELR